MSLLNDLATQVHWTAVKKRFWDEQVDVHFVLSKLALIHSEVSEVLEAVRKQKGSETITEEIADILIRTLDLYEGLFEHGIVSHSLDAVMAEKMQKNKGRPDKHGVLA